MIFRETPLKDAYLIELEKRGDDRGFFARYFCENEFSKHGLDSKIVQINNSFSADKATLRGFHYQKEPHAESKTVRCIQGALFDVIVDLRKTSPSYGKSYGVVLNSENRFMLHVPKGFAHAFLTLQENTEALYLVSEFYNPESESGMRWNDPGLNIDWPVEPVVISDKDMHWPDYDF